MRIKKQNKVLAVSSMMLATTHLVCAQDTPPAEPGTLDRIFNVELPEAIGKSKISLNARMRWENADQDSIVPAADLKESNAFTLRTRLGLTSAPFHGFQGMIEGEDITVLGPRHNYNAAGSNGQPGRTAIADPRTTELNQAWISYSNWDSVLKGGRQRIVLDNHRFIGDVGWRQNMQTFDAVSLENKSIKDLSLFYGYVWEVNRVFGDVSGLPLPFRDFDSDSHLFNIAYSGFKFAKLTAYTYLLDFDNSPVNSTATYGGSAAGTYTIDKDKNQKLSYRGEVAWQTDYADSALDYGTEYYNLELSGECGRYLAGAGYEVLGSDSNDSFPPGPVRTGFKTPLATLHAFNGWADVFLATPNAGLRDLYAFAQVKLPWDMPLRFVYHKYDADSGGADFGQEYDVVLSKKLGKHWSALAKYAYYDGKDAAPPSFGAPIDVQKFWLQVEFNF